MTLLSCGGSIYGCNLASSGIFHQGTNVLTVRFKAVLLINAATLLWAGNIIAGRALRAEIGPWTLAGSRALVAAVCFAALWRAWGAGARRPTRREWALLAFMALTGVVGFQVLHYTGLRFTTAINAGLVGATNPVITLVLSALLLGQRIGRRQAAGALLSVVGAGMVILGVGFADFSINPGDLIILTASVCWSLYYITGKVVLASRGALWVTAISCLVALPLLAAPAVVEATATAPTLSWSLALTVLYIGVGPAFIAFFCWNEGVRLIGPNSAMVMINTLPLYAVVLSLLLLGEVPGWQALAGGALIVSGCFITLYRTDK
jgi:drug/metabolite transporter (DMT)-like permease